MKGRQTELQLRINRDRKTLAMQTDTGHCQTQGICDSLDDGKQRDSEREGEDWKGVPSPVAHPSVKVQRRPPFISHCVYNLCFTVNLSSSSFCIFPVCSCVWCWMSRYVDIMSTSSQHNADYCISVLWQNCLSAVQHWASRHSVWTQARQASLC